jgi:hypothetical protein
MKKRKNNPQFGNESVRTLINNRNSGTEETQKLRKLPGSFKFDENNLGRR